MPNPDDRSQIRLVTEETRGNLIQDMLGHPRVSPSFDELNYMNPSKSRSTIRDHLNRLIEAGVVSKLLLPETDRQNDRPYTFYILSAKGLELLVNHNLFIDELDSIREDYESVEKPGFIKKCEYASRPASVEERLSDIKEAGR